jgi:PncC family amidohydrolase
MTVERSFCVIDTLHQKLIDKNLTVTTAESCTGGMIAEHLTRRGGSSAYFLGSIISYSNQVKTSLLDVETSTLEQYGAVSRETAVAMLDGLAMRIPSDIGIAVTGVAGPGGGGPHKPVGTVWVGIRFRDRFHYTRLQLTGDRNEIRQGTTDFVLNTVIKLIDGEL